MSTMGQMINKETRIIERAFIQQILPVEGQKLEKVMDSVKIVGKMMLTSSIVINIIIAGALNQLW